MKKVFSLLFLFLTLSLSSQAIELEGRTGISLAAGNWGLHTAAYLGIPVSSRFAIRPGVLLHTVEWNSPRQANKWGIGVNIPVFASFRIPLSEKVRVRLDAGPYLGIAHEGQLGGAAEVGVEVGKIYLGGGYFQNCLHNSHAQLNLSVGYTFEL